eukprot:GHVQ01041259.1.p1 GENE.GHVQ01041259.1~~GHVQ01041259.1.p1  ORF type:complete len:239 (+),score=17.40 GHVQ01041259.1:1313-2029(+)
MRDGTIFFLHCVAGHVGVGRTMAAISKRYWWPKMVEDVRAGCRQCLLCTRLRPGRKQVFAGGTLMAPVPGYLVALDHVGPFNLTGAGGQTNKSWVLTMIDRCTKFAVAALAIKTTAKETWYAFSTRWLTVFGVPRRIIVDGASSFKGDFAAEVREAGIQKLVTGPYYPQGNGVVEAFHKFLRHSMGALTLGTKADLDKATTACWHTIKHPMEQLARHQHSSLMVAICGYQRWGQNRQR